MFCADQHVVIVCVLGWHFLCRENNIADMLIEDTLFAINKETRLFW